MRESNKQLGYPQKKQALLTKRYCQTLQLKSDPLLIEEYVRLHTELHHWPEIRDGIRAVGILEMEIYRLGTALFMIVETSLDFEWESAFATLSRLPRQQEWEQYVAAFQEVNGEAPDDKWKMMERIFHLYR